MPLKALFLVETISGALDKGVTYSLDEHDGSDAKVRQVPSMSDMLICYPTQMGMCLDSVITATKNHLCKYH